MKKSKASDHSVIVDGSVVNSRIVIAADRHHDARGKTASAEELRSATRTYLNYLHDRYRYLELKGMGVAERVPLRLPLLEVFVPLKARVEMPKGETWDRTARLAGRELSDEEAEKLGLRLSEPQLVNDLVRGHGGLIVLGDPGSGKTTFLKSLAVAYATGSGDGLGLGPRLPILLPLSAYAKAIESDDVRLDRFIGTYFHSLGCNAAVLAMLQEDLKAGRALLLLDGLDEVSDLSLRQTVARRVADFFAFHRRAGNKFVLTSRIVGYREVRTVAEGLTECTLVDFDDEEIALFTEKWTSALERQAQGATGVAAADAARERHDLLAAVRGHAGVRRLAANPLLLTILALMKRQGVPLPERRVELYDLYVRTLLSSWNRARGLDRPPQRDLDVVETVRILAPLALWMHEVDSGLGLVKREDLHRKLQEIFTDRGEDDPERRARAFLSDVREYAGLILERGPEEYGFIHLTFEEYLAAVAIALAAQGDRRGLVEAIAGRLGDPAWHEVALLLIGYVGLIQQLDVVAGAVVERLVGERPGAPGQAVVLAGAAVFGRGDRRRDAAQPALRGRSSGRHAAGRSRARQAASRGRAPSRTSRLVAGGPRRLRRGAAGPVPLRGGEGEARDRAALLDGEVSCHQSPICEVRGRSWLLAGGAVDQGKLGMARDTTTRRPNPPSRLRESDLPASRRVLVRSGGVLPLADHDGGVVHDRGRPSSGERREIPLPASGRDGVGARRARRGRRRLPVGRRLSIRAGQHGGE